MVEVDWLAGGTSDGVGYRLNIITDRPIAVDHTTHSSTRSRSAAIYSSIHTNADETRNRRSIHANANTTKMTDACSHTPATTLSENRRARSTHTTEVIATA